MSHRLFEIKTPHYRGVQLGNFSYVEEPLGLGAAGGNQFDIVLRGIAGASPEQVLLLLVWLHLKRQQLRTSTACGMLCCTVRPPA